MGLLLTRLRSSSLANITWLNQAQNHPGHLPYWQNQTSTGVGPCLLVAGLGGFTHAAFAKPPCGFELRAPPMSSLSALRQGELSVCIAFALTRSVAGSQACWAVLA